MFHANKPKQENASNSFPSLEFCHWFVPREWTVRLTEPLATVWACALTRTWKTYDHISVLLLGTKRWLLGVYVKTICSIWFHFFSSSFHSICTVMTRSCLLILLQYSLNDLIRGKKNDGLFVVLVVCWCAVWLDYGRAACRQEKLNRRHICTPHAMSEEQTDRQRRVRETRW